MASPKNQPDTAPDEPSKVSTEDVLKRFQDASAKFLQATLSAHESAVRESAQACLDLHDQVRTIEQEAYRAVMEATRRHVNQLGQQATGRPEDIYSARLQSQFDYEREVRQIYVDTEAKLRALAQKASGESGGGDVVRRVANQRQEAYQAYVADLQKAWSETKALDPQTMNAIASHILCTINMC